MHDVDFNILFTILDPPPYKKWICCGKLELSVLLAGIIENTKHDEFEHPFRFEHILKYNIFNFFNNSQERF